MSDCLYLLESELSFHLHFIRFTPRTTERSRFRDPPRRGPPPLPPIFTTPRPTTTVAAAPSDSFDSQRIESNQAITNDVTSLFDVLAEGDNDYQELVPPAFWHLKSEKFSFALLWIFQSKLHQPPQMKWNRDDISLECIGKDRYIFRDGKIRRSYSSLCSLLKFIMATKNEFVLKG